jgi:hypothetical protein
MVSDAKRRALMAEITELRWQQMETLRKVTFGGWTTQVEATHLERSEHITALLRELGELDGRLKCSNTPEGQAANLNPHRITD